MLAWKRPGNLGVKGGRLAPPKKTPNCVSSQADPSDAEHYIAPIAFKGTTAAAMAAARTAVESMGARKNLRAGRGFPYPRFPSKLLGFVGDPELGFDRKAGRFPVPA